MSTRRQQTTGTNASTSIRTKSEDLVHKRVIAEKNLCDNCLGQLYVDTTAVGSDTPSVVCEDCEQPFV